MAPIAAYVESDVAMADDHGTAAWSFDLELWGRCGQGPDAPTALAALAAQADPGARLVIAERIAGDEQAFIRDHVPASREERQTTAKILTDARVHTLALLTACGPAVLDFDDPDRRLPIWAPWRTLRQMAWHLADTESRYYLPSLGLPPRPAELDLFAELARSAEHVRHTVHTMPGDLVNEFDGHTWTTTKVLRRLAWHERSELNTMRRLARHAERKLETSRQ